MEIKKIKEIEIEDYNYHLPDVQIAKYPLPDREQSKLLIYNSKIEESNFFNIGDHLPDNSLLIFNNTKVIRARLEFHKTSGARVEIFCLEPYLPAEYVQSFGSTKSCSWTAMIGNSRKWKEGALLKSITVDDKEIEISAERVRTESGNSIVTFSWNSSDVTFSEILESCGNIPIPPYLERESEESDLSNYQTVYSKIDGSVAAPTAGLHFTDPLLNRLKDGGVELGELTLHVGAGTFKPVKSDQIGDHDMHTEHISVTSQFVKKLIANLGKIVAVGTTSVRTAESLYWMGVKVINNSQNKDLHIDQWDPYERENNISVKESLSALLYHIEQNEDGVLNSSTQIIIAPGYKFKVVDAIVTNFHQPQSTLLLLISAFIGDDWKKIYKHAVDNNYRFLSYGDSNLYFRK